MKGSAVRPSQAVPLSRFGGLGGGTGGVGVVRRRVGVVGEGVHATCLMTSYCLHPSPTRAAYFLQINYSPWFHSSKLLWTLLQFHPNDFLHHSASFNLMKYAKVWVAPFWNDFVLYGHCPNSFRLSPPPCQTGKHGKKCPKPSWQALTPPGKCVGKMCPKPSWQAFEPRPPYGQCPYGNNTFQKGANI